MIVDIVELPRRLQHFKNGAIDTRDTCGFPLPALYRVSGFWEPDDASYLCIGGKHDLITGKDCLFRYKFIEPTKFGIAEYYVITADKIDIRFPARQKRVRLYCPYVTLTDPKTMLVRRFMLLAGVWELLHFETEDNVEDYPADAVTVNEIKNLLDINSAYDVCGPFFSTDLGLKSIVEKIKSNPNYDDVLITEIKGDDDIQTLLNLGSNISAYNNMTLNESPCFWCDITDVFRNVTVPNLNVVNDTMKTCSLLAHFMYGGVVISDIKHLFGMTYDTHAFQRWFNDGRLDPDIEISLGDGNTDKFVLEILKYVSRLPYNEFELTIDNSGLYNIKVYNPYDPMLSVVCEETVKENIGKFANEVVAASQYNIEALKSWGEEVYITIKRKDGRKRRFYFDSLSTIIGSQSLIRDYDGHMFT